MNFETIVPRESWYYFVPVNYEMMANYENFWSVTKIFSEYNSGIVSARDNLVFNFSIEGLKQKISTFINSKLTNKEIEQKFGIKDTSGWSLDNARKYTTSLKEWEAYIEIASYRPFDNRYIFYHPQMLEGARQQIMQNMLTGDNVGLVVNKQFKVIGTKNFDTNYVTGTLLDFNFFRRGGALLCPLYLYKNKPELF